MNDKDNKLNDQETAEDKAGKAEETRAQKEFSFSSNDAVISSADLLRIDETEKDILSINIPAENDAVPAAVEKLAGNESELDERMKDPVFRELAEAKLPSLPKENRARLQMQSPTRLYFYWSVQNNPFQTLNKAFGGRIGSYTLVAKLINRSKNTEDVFPVDADGNWWFNVDPDSNYRAEIGFYAPNRPYIRIMFSNAVHTPRKNPSKRTDYTPSFNVNAYQFAEVLDVSGYRRDAFEVAIAGDDVMAAETATHQTYSQIFGEKAGKFTGNDGDQLRLVLLALSSGYSLEDIRGEISVSLFNALSEELENIKADRILAALKENFDVFADEIIEEEMIGAAVFGASLVNFPKTLKKRSVPKTLLPKLSKLSNPEPLSSFGLK
ncbi:MAG: DUF4912 domain-containing protein [Acidobacteria bacterium]|nr:DUF4912 domain-containing protein [Acidobacteriota bacterium]